MTARFHRRREALRVMRDLETHSSNVSIIHYSCESFYDRADGRTPRVTSIAIRNLQTGQTHSFSIHKIAETRRIEPAAIRNHYDELELAMLDEFFVFIRVHINDRWVHWNMRDINYGFPAIEHRYRVLGGTPEVIDDSRKFDMARLLIDLFGPGYVGHPRLSRLVERNRISKRDFLSGAEEAEAFESGDFVRLHQSTLRKVDIMANILERTVDRTLKTNARWREIYGLTLAGVAEFLREHWTFTLLTLAASVASIIGLVSLFK